MKIRFTSVLLLLLLITTMVSSASDDTRAYNWYCKNNDTHTRPILDPEFGFIHDCGGSYCGSEDEKVIYLTFDAGYENGNIAKILDTLKAHNARGAFFILENLVTREPELVRRMADEGHLVCNHTAHHTDMTKVTDKDEFRKKLERLDKAVLEATGVVTARFYRPPEGKFSRMNLEFANALGYKTVFWSFAYADWDNQKQPDPDAALKKILDHTHNGEVLLLHPTSSTNAAILDRLLCEWEREGYRFGTLDELYD